jgi:diguanylate cyclase (GGDEF)-like protein
MEDWGRSPGISQGGSHKDVHRLDHAALAERVEDVMKVLVVDGDAAYRTALETTILGLGHECLTASEGRAGWELLKHFRFDVLIADCELPLLDGVHLCQRVRTELESGHLYVILATAPGSWEQARESMLAGADDYLVKPIQEDSLALRLIGAERLIGLHRSIEGANQELRTLARRDALTGLGNRRCLTEDLTVMSDRMRRYGHRFSVALFDIDNFRAFNEMYGHEQGDAALKAISIVLDATSRAGDTCYRYGGEEFLCVYPEQSPERAHIVVQRLRARVALLGIPHRRGAAGGVITVSAGIAEMSAETMTAQHAIQAADMALYQAKKLGRDRTELAVPSPRLPVSAAAMRPAEDVAVSVVLPR